MREQNYKNHRFLEPTTYFFLFPLMLILFAAIVTECVQFAQGKQALWPAITMTSLLLTAIILSVRIRLYALIAQDRAIRAEEQIRHFALTGQLLDSRLSIRQIIALRFAADAEFPNLAKKAAEEQLSPEQIKQAIQNWRPDWYRV